MKLEIIPLAENSKTTAWLALGAISAGRAQELSGDLEPVDLNEYLTNGRGAVFLVRVCGDSMETEIESGDLLIVDRNRAAKQNDKIIASVNGDFTIKIFRERPALQLVASNGKYLSRKITRRDNFQIFGVVTHIIKKI